MNPTPAPGARRAALAFIFVTVLLDMLAFGIIIPVLPHLIEDFVGGDTAAAARWVGLFGTVFALIQFLFNPVQGALSDRFGRRPVVLLSNLGLGLDFVLMALVNTLPLLLVGRIIAGVTSASVSTANAYIADVTPPEKRAGSYGLLGAAFGIGFVFGPALGGFLGGIDLRLPFWVAAGLALTNFCYGFFVLPESLPPERRTKRLDIAHANPFGALVLMRRYPQVIGLAVIVLLTQLAHYSLVSTFVLYGDYRYAWDQQRVGFVLAGVGACNALVQAVLVRRLAPRFGNRALLLTGLTFATAGFLIFGFAPTGGLFLLGIPVLSLWGLAGPSTQAIATRQVDPTEQGRLQGMFASVSSLAGIFGPSLHTQVFAAFIGPEAGLHLPGAAFVLSAGLLVVAIGQAWRVTKGRA